MYIVQISIPCNIWYLSLLEIVKQVKIFNWSKRHLLNCEMKKLKFDRQSKIP